jgi:D-serine dehydratase
MSETKCPNCGWSKTYEIDKSNSYNLLIEVSNENERLFCQLQAHKEKEDKLRELARDMIMPDGDYGEVVDKGRKLLKILDGSDE